MYCVNCGKQVNGTIPICQDCALFVLHNSPDTPLNEKVTLEAEDFSITSDSKVTSSELKTDNGVEPAESSPNCYKDEYNDSLLMGIVVTIIMIVTIIAIVSIWSGSF